MNEVVTWFAMNGDGMFVWPCYLVTLIVLIGNLVVARHSRYRLVEDITLQIQSERAQ